ncbi:amino acid adenylation domain-containing protein [Tumebacillus lipolyticus]|uniref:Amino acid adenylation domain-containing protein n=1 Tax=Tumebacillus lipolyticus TaxID=1280370 RepID=A0ABW4ZU23_9BACL
MNLKQSVSFTETASFVELLRARAESQPEQLAYRFSRDGEEMFEELTWGEAERRARSIAAYLQEKGAAGERVLLLFPPGLDYLTAFFGCLFAGAVAVPAYPPTSSRLLPRLQTIVADSQARFALTTKESFQRFQVHLAKADSLSNLDWLLTGDAEGMEDSWNSPHIGGESLAFLQYTSGSTSAPKGVMVTHGNLLHNSALIQRSFGTDADDHGVIWLPPYHDMGLIGGLLQPVLAGFSVTLMAPADFIQRPLRWLEMIAKTKATVSGAPNFAYDLAVEKSTEAQRASLDLSSWRIAFNGAEPIRAETMKRFADAFSAAGFADDAFYPCYGLAEGTLLVSGAKGLSSPVAQKFAADALTQNRIEEASDRTESEARELVGCGEVAVGQDVRIVHAESGVECAPDEIGEIWVAGASVAQGYFGRPEQSEATFRACLSNGDGPFLRTGDLGFLKGGQLFVTGRIKDLIIIRGRNHYPQDIEATVENAHLALRKGAGSAFSVTVEGEERLVVAQEVDRHHRNVQVDEIASAIRQLVAEAHGVQVYAVLLLKFGGIPMTSSGKVQRHACREGYLNGSLVLIGSDVHNAFDREMEESFLSEPLLMSRAELRSLSVEERHSRLLAYLRHQAAHVLKILPAKLDPALSLSSLGLDSLMAVQLQHDIERDFGIDIDSSRLLEGIHLIELATLIDQLIEGSDASTSDESECDHDRLSECEMSRAQQGLWFWYKRFPQSPAYNISRAFHLEGAVDERALQGAFQALVDRHPALRTSFFEREGQLLQRVHNEQEVSFQVEEAATWGDERLNARLQEEADRPFDLEKGRSMRIHLFRRSDQEVVMLWALHHIVVDFWSFNLLFRDLSALYAQLRSGHAATAVEESASAISFINWQHAFVASDAGNRKLAYWQEKLSGELPALHIPLDFPRPAERKQSGASLHVRVGAGLTARLKQTAHEQEVTLYQLLLGAYGVLMHRYSEQEDLIVGTYMAGRSRSSHAELVGYLTNALPLRFDFSNQPTFSTFLSQVRKTVVEALAHQDYPFDLLVEKMRIERDPSRSPLFQTAFVMQNVGAQRQMLAPFALGCEGATGHLDDLLLRSRTLEEKSSLFDLTVTVAESDGELLVKFQYDTALFAEATICRMMGHWQTLLADIAADSNRSVSSLRLITDAEIVQLSAWRALAKSEKVDETLCTIFEQRAMERPDAHAVTFENQSLTYGELNSRANRLARYLRQRGVSDGMLVGISMERSVDLLVGIVAILKAGGAYLPLDPAYPMERLQYMLDDSQAELVLTQERMLGKLSRADVQTICIDRDWVQIDALNDANIEGERSPDRLAYVIYTSGSTGNPKGVMVTHRNVVRLFTETDAWFQFDHHDVWTLFHSYAFDFSVWEMWGALLFGGKLVVVPYWVSRTPEEFYRLLQNERVTVLNQTPSAFRQLMRVEEQSGSGGEIDLRYVVFGGEALDVQSLQPWFARHGDSKPQLINMYGITETTVHVTYRPLRAADAHRASSVIGSAIPDLQVLLLDRNQQQVPIGVPGEMYIGGAGVTRGYFNRPELTSDRFVTLPALSGELLYRSGDLARYLANGDLEYWGRIDHQVKLRGYRIELGEIESALIQHEEVDEAVAMVREDDPDEKKLVAYVVAKHKQPPTVRELRTFLGNRLPDHMVPHSFVLIDEIPLTANGKVDRKSLPAPDLFAFERARYAPPSSFEEEVLISIWERVLDVHPIGADDNFFLLGGDSIRSIKVASLAKDQKLDVSLEQIYQHQTVRELACSIKTSHQPEERVEPIAPFELISDQDRAQLPEGIEDAYPVPAIQMSYFFHSESSEVYKAYLGTYRLRGPFHEPAFREAIRRMVKRHEIFRTSFDLSTFSMPLQLVHIRAEVTLAVYDLRHLHSAEQEHAIKEFVYEEERRRFDWSQPGLIRFHAHRLSDETFQFTMCEPLLDGWSAASTMTGLFTEYLKVLKDHDAPEEPMLKAKFSRFVQRELQTKRSPESQAFWERELHDVLTTRIPRWTGPNATFASDKEDRVIVPISQEVSEGLLSLSRSLSVPLKDVVLAAHLKVVSLLSGQDDVVTGIVSGGRPEEEDGEKVLGAMVNTMPFRLHLAGSTWEELVRQTFEKERESLPHRRYPLVDLQRQFSGGQRLFETIFNYTHFHVYQGVTESGEIEILDGWHRESAYVPLTTQFSVDPQSSQLLCVLDYYPEDLCREQVGYIAEYYAKTLEAMVKSPTSKHEAHRLLAEEELRLLLGEDDRKRADYPLDRCFPELFRTQADKTPARTALICREKSIRYEELERRSNRLANYLLTLGIAPGMFVGHLGERNIDWAISMIAIFKLGAVYIPLDPKYPNDRLRYMASHSNMAVLLTSEELSDRVVQDGMKIVSLDRDQERIAQMDEAFVDRAITPTDLAYVIYTSGSTGLPKGAMVEHIGMVNHLYAKMEVLRLTEEDVVAQNASQCFDVSVWQLLVALLVGGKTVILPDEAETDPVRLLGEMDEAGITIWETVPTVLQATLESISLFREARPTFAQLRWLFVSGEALPPALCRLWFQLFPQIRMINACGATECSDDVTHYVISGPPAEEVTVMPIGEVIANCTLYVLDRAMQPVPFGVPGELCYGGICVGRGYLNDEEKTNRAFQADPFSQVPGARLYRSGDLVRLRNDGVLEFLGRIDHQVKIRGFRIELGEVEAVINHHPDVLQVVATAHRDDRGNSRLVAYLTLAPESLLSTAELRDYMRKSVPEHMVPSFFIMLEEFPMTLNGKVDRKRLPTPSIQQEEREYKAPETEVQRAVAEIWQSVLSYDPVSLTDNFFEVGGESILATRLISLLRKRFSIELPLRTLFEASTVEGLAAAVQSQVDLGEDDEMKALLEELEGLSDEEALLLLGGDEAE